MPLANARQHPENQKETQAGHSSERTVEGRREEICVSTPHRAPVGQGPSGPDWLAIAFGFWSGRALTTGTAWAGLCFIHHHQRKFVLGSPG